MRMKSLIIVILIVCLLFSAAVSLNAKDIQINISGKQIGSGGHRILSLIIEGMKDTFPDIPIRNLPSTTEVARCYLGRIGDVDVILENNAIGLLLQNGLENFSTIEWGPQPISYVYVTPNTGMVLATRGDSGIKGYEDLPGRTIAKYPAGPVNDLNTAALLAFGGISYDDMETVDFAGPTPAYKAVIEGRLDVCFMNVASAAAHELMSMPMGGVFLPTPLDNEEGWKRVKEICPAFFPYESKWVAGQDEPRGVMSCGYPTFMAWLNVEEDRVYDFLKVLDESREAWQAKEIELKDYTMEINWEIWEGDLLPMHPGAIKYYKEIGQWTDEREEMNQERLEIQSKLKSLWDEAREVAFEEGMPSGDFPEYWNEILQKEK